MPDLLSAALDAEQSGNDPRYAEVDLTDHGLGYVRLQRVSCLAPLIHGVPTLIAALPKGDGSEGQRMDMRRSKEMASTIEAVICESVCACRATEDAPWRRLRVGPKESDHQPGAGRIHLQVIPAPAQLAMFKAAISLHTGQEVEALLASLFRFAGDLLARLLAESGVLRGRMDGAPLEPGAVGGQRGGPDDRGEGSIPADDAEE